MNRPTLALGLLGLLVLLPRAAPAWQPPRPESPTHSPYEAPHEASYEASYEAPHGAPHGALQLDAGTPDGSVGNGGADRDSPESGDTTGRVVTTCTTQQDCSPRFSCAQGRCRYVGVREAERVGCLGTPEGTLAVAGLALAAAGRRGRERS